jgi:hypothetical protein
MHSVGGESRLVEQSTVCTGVAWLSSARVVRCWVKSRNERNPRVLLPARNGGNSGQTAWINREEGGDDVKSVWPLRPGLHTYYNGWYRENRYREVEEIVKTSPSSDCRLQLACMKPESLVMPHQLRRREYVPGSCTHRPSHHGSWSRSKYLRQPYGGRVLKQDW